MRKIILQKSQSIISKVKIMFPYKQTGRINFRKLKSITKLK